MNNGNNRGYILYNHYIKSSGVDTTVLLSSPTKLLLLGELDSGCPVHSQ